MVLVMRTISAVSMILSKSERLGRALYYVLRVLVLTNSKDIGSEFLTYVPLDDEELELDDEALVEAKLKS